VSRFLTALETNSKQGILSPVSRLKTKTLAVWSKQRPWPCHKIELEDFTLSYKCIHAHRGTFCCTSQMNISHPIFITLRDNDNHMTSLDQSPPL